MNSPDCKYEMSLSASGKYAIILVTGEVTSAIAAKFGREAEDFGNNTGVDRYLFDLRGARNIETVSGNFDFAYEKLPETNLSRTSRSAMLSSPEDSSHDFVETLLRNSGYKVRMFKEKQLAVAWLEE